MSARIQKSSQLNRRITIDFNSEGYGIDLYLVKPAGDQSIHLIKGSTCSDDSPDLDELLAKVRKFLRPYFPIENGGSKRV